VKVKEAIEMLSEAISSLLRASCLIVQVRDGVKHESTRSELGAARGVITVLEYFLRHTIYDLVALKAKGMEEV